MQKDFLYQNFNIVDSNKLFFCIQRYLKDKILREPVMVKKLVLFFASYFDAPYEGDDINDFFNHMAHANYATMRSELEVMCHSTLRGKIFFIRY